MFDTLLGGSPIALEINIQGEKHWPGRPFNPTDPPANLCHSIQFFTEDPVLACLVDHHVFDQTLVVDTKG